MCRTVQKRAVDPFDEETTAKVGAAQKAVESFDEERTEETPAPFVPDTGPPTADRATAPTAARAPDSGSGVVPLPSSRNSGGYCKLDVRVRFYVDLDDLDTEEEIDLEEVTALGRR